MNVIEIDAAHEGRGGASLAKLNPLANWTLAQVWQYIREHQVPYNDDVSCLSTVKKLLKIGR